VLVHSDIPQDLRVSILKDVEWKHLDTIHGSKGIGEPPLFLGCVTFFAIRDAIQAARRDAGILAHEEPLDLVSPATPERIRLACGDRIVRKAAVKRGPGDKGFFVLAQGGE
jgi:xanthine dehydrogenase/oxidase